MYMNDVLCIVFWGEKNENPLGEKGLSTFISVGSFQCTDVMVLQPLQASMSPVQRFTDERARASTDTARGRFE